MSPRAIRIFLYVVAGIVVAGASMAKRTAAERVLQSETLRGCRAEQCPTTRRENRDQPVEAIVRNRTTWTELLQEMEFDPQTVYSVTEAARRVFDLRSLRPGNKLTAVRSRAGELRSVTYRIDPERELVVSKEKDGEAFHAEIKDTPGKIHGCSQRLGRRFVVRQRNRRRRKTRISRPPGRHFRLGHGLQHRHAAWRRLPHAGREKAISGWLGRQPTDEFWSPSMTT